MTRFLDADEVRERVLTETFVRTMELHETLASTNDRGVQLAGHPQLAAPCLMVAERQTAGRGRGANRWWSAEGALTFSLVLPLDVHRLPVSRWPELSLTVGTSVCAAVRPFVPSADVRLKWPNDVYLNGRKVSGILVEVPACAQGKIVVGVGLNVNNSIQSAPHELQSKAIAMCDAAGETLVRLDVLIAILQAFEQQLRLLVHSPEDARRRWRQDNLLLGRSVTVGNELGVVTGTCEGIDDDGALLLRTGAGPQRIYGGVVQDFT
jgi:BirA family biotin operon repressor/biotin-[acetyl-CoA-carboxylase] ligase